MWNGAFSPSMRKSIGAVRFMPLSQMSSRDWDWLEYDNLRETARNRIASTIVSGNLIGFFQVMITEKAKAKNEYLWPATKLMLDEFEAGDLMGPDFFRYESDVDAENPAVEAVETLRSGATFLTIPMILSILRVVAQVSEDEYTKQHAEEVDERLLSELDREDIEILLAAIMLWELQLDEAERLLDDAPESDEADEVRDWINDRVAEIRQARQQSNQIAAGRGLTR